MHLVVDVEGPFYYCDSDGRQCVRILHPNEVLDILKENPELDNEASSQFKDDMENSVANMALALSYQAYEMQHSKEPLLEIIINEQDSYLRSEQAVIEDIRFILELNCAKALMLMRILNIVQNIIKKSI